MVSFHHGVILDVTNNVGHCLLHNYIEPIPVNLTAEDVHLQAVNITWTSLNHNESYTLTVNSKNTQPRLYELRRPFFTFTAPEGAPPCEVYNFSVIANSSYIGATYTGAGCGVPSTVLSLTLPSLPDKVGLESSLNYSLRKEDTNAVISRISIEVSNHRSTIE